MGKDRKTSLKLRRHRKQRRRRAGRRPAGVPAVEPLESRILLSTTVSLDGNDLKIEDTGGGDTDDTITLSASATDLTINDPNNLLDTTRRLENRQFRKRF